MFCFGVIIPSSLPRLLPRWVKEKGKKKNKLVYDWRLAQACRRSLSQHHMIVKKLIYIHYNGRFLLYFRERFLFYYFLKKLIV
jgi:hypothetical protein